MIIDLNWAGWNLVQALTKRLELLGSYGSFQITNLADNPQRFSEFLHSTEVSVVAIAVLADGNIKLDLGTIRTNKHKQILEPECAPRHTYHTGRLFSGPI